MLLLLASGVGMGGSESEGDGDGTDGELLAEVNVIDDIGRVLR